MWFEQQHETQQDLHHSTEQHPNKSDCVLSEDQEEERGNFSLRPLIDPTV